MRRNRLVGLGALQKDKQRLELFQQKGSSLAKEELEKLTVQMGEFRTNLEKFAQHYKKDIKKSGVFRRQFQQMCAVAGVDPLRSSANFWVKLLGVGDFYYELAVQIVEVFLSTNHKNGGIMSMNELLSRVQASRSTNLQATDSITEEDLLEAIKKLRVLGSNIREVPSKGSYIIHATPAELNSDHIHITQLAHETGGFVSLSSLEHAFNWSQDRIQKALDELVMEGVLWVDHQGHDGQTLYWFTSLR